MPYEPNLIDKFLVNLQILMFNCNPYFLDLIILLLVVFWVIFAFGVIKFKKYRKLKKPTLKYKIIVAVFGICFIISVILLFSCLTAMWFAMMSV